MSAHANLERRRQAIYGWLLLSPAAVLLTVFAFYPSIATLWSSLFSRHTRRNPSEFVGTENYADLFADPTFWLVAKNNLFYAGVTSQFRFSLRFQWRFGPTPRSRRGGLCVPPISHRPSCR